MITLHFQKSDLERFTPEFTHSAICYLNGLRNFLMTTSSYYFPLEAREVYQLMRKSMLELFDDSLNLLNHHERTLKICSNEESDC